MSNKIVTGLNEDWVEITDAVDASSGFIQVQKGIVRISRTALNKPTAADGYITLTKFSGIEGDIERFCRGATGGRVWAFAPGDPYAEITCGFEAA